MPKSRAKASRTQRGRPRANSAQHTLGRERILQATLELIDEKGLAAFGIRDLASRLGVFPAAIYWHVPNRDALVAGAIGIALAGVGEGLPAGNWQLRLGALMRQFRAALRRHPALAPAVASQLAYNAAFDATLLNEVVAALEDAGFEGDALVDAFNVVIGAMCGFATLELSTAPVEAAGDWEAACCEQVDTIDAQRYPALGRNAHALRNRAFLLRWSSGEERPLDSGFDAWIDVVLSGLEARSQALRSTQSKRKKLASPRGAG
ncbi:TetR/AcrR family transcriptional regulator [Variovorax sp. OV329]|uniref:TetR/AcrR family transcriptional regulator n=1 Tax=Variovorax sp. OV329 TaxID=1882825 RepID=UPI00158705FE|nr:TetR/AcrR family transcriptional regulator [Variovorax sp. OV329]